jgi:hypothetical protein
MSIYVIRYGDLLKIGYSSKLGDRVYQIIRGIPGGTATLVGHMPGDRDVEAHLHRIFESSRFSGEWFRETTELVAWCNLMLIRDLPEVAVDRVTGRRKEQASQAAMETKQRFRDYAAHRWPTENHQERTDALADALGWRRSRLLGFYHGDGRNVLRSTEANQLDGLFALHRPRVAGDDE